MHHAGAQYRIPPNPPCAGGASRRASPVLRKDVAAGLDGGSPTRWRIRPFVIVLTRLFDTGRRGGREGSRRGSPAAGQRKFAHQRHADGAPCRRVGRRRCDRAIIDSLTRCACASRSDLSPRTHRLSGERQRPGSAAGNDLRPLDAAPSGRVSPSGARVVGKRSSQHHPAATRVQFVLRIAAHWVESPLRSPCWIASD
jgi:hypothetical protein